MTHDHAERLISVLEHIDAHLAALAEVAATSSVEGSRRLTIAERLISVIEHIGEGARSASAVNLPEPSGDAQSPLSITRE